MRFDTDQHVPNGTSSTSIRDYRPVGKELFAFGAAKTARPMKWTRKLTEVRFNEPDRRLRFRKARKEELKKEELKLVSR